MFVPSQKSVVLSLAGVLIFGALFLLYNATKDTTVVRVTATVESGPVRELVSVSGVITAEDTAKLGFPVTGTLAEILVRKGDFVATGTVLARLDTRSLDASRREAQAVVAGKRAELAELRAGTRSETRVVSTETVALKRAQLETIKRGEAIKIANARKLLRTNDLSAYSNDPEETATAPTITGSYLCETEGSYTLSVFRSGGDSKYSFKLTGLETGTYEVSFDQPTSFGTCGLRAQFSTADTYTGSTWRIDIPNKKAASYTSLKNTLDLTIEQAETAILLAERELTLAEASASDTTAGTRIETVLKAEAGLAQAEAALAQVEAELARRTITAPFSGTITTASALPGETMTTEPFIHLLATTRFELTARIPEVDIGKLAIGQKADVIFDTEDTQVLIATIDYLSPSATTIDGVAYYEARLTLTNYPTWLRSGLNADIDIIIKETLAETRVPARFISESADGSYSVLTATTDTTTATSTIDVLFRGNDGFVSVRGLPAGTVIVAP
jgi:multidrug efflux pump subunit AcrA (membrane-fusion protein)